MTWVRAAISLVAVLAALAAPGTALAGVDVSYSQSGGLVVSAPSRATMNLSAPEVDGARGFKLTQSDPSGVLTEDTITAGTGCDELNFFTVFCRTTGSHAVTMTLSDAERVTPTGLTFGDNLVVAETVGIDALGFDVPAFISSMSVDARGADDTIQGSRASDTLLGGGGDDQLIPETGNDVVDGGAGNDFFIAGNFDQNGPGPNGADVYKGGPGTDVVGYFGRVEPIVVTLDGLANDGMAGESDNVGPSNDVEDVFGGDRDDTIDGNDRANDLDGRLGNDTLRGAGGDDELDGSSDDDTLIGGAGADILLDRGTGGGSGSDDTINARDGAPDLKIDCGGGLEDRAIIDLFDKPKIIKNCELVTSFAIDDAPPGTPLGRRLRIRKDGVARIAIACPRRAKVRCHGRLKLRDPKRRRHVLASASYTARLGRKARVALRLTKKERALLRRRGRVLATTLEQGISRRGPRSAERLIRLGG